MLVSLQHLDVQLNDKEMKLVNQQILRHLQGSTVVDTLDFLRFANQIDMPLGDKFLSLSAKNIALSSSKAGIDPGVVEEAYQALQIVSVCF